MSFDYPIESFGFNYRENGYHTDGFASTMWKVAHYIVGLSTIIAAFDLYHVYVTDYGEVRARSRIALVPGLNLLLVPIDLFHTVGHIWNCCITAD